ncbi:MAG: ATP-dependent helicase [Methanomassiliicoccaceae archaeon]|nr:ATP-dependent helicase [Methanomassiliicoccaceae archaeon]
MTKLNECQQRIADTVDGMVVVDAGPGTGKTHTLVSRYMNILKKDVGTSDILALTFTNNAADEMSERIKSEMTMEGKNAGDVRSSTFDSFCMKVVRESPETVSRFFKTKETLTRNIGIIDNNTLNAEYFKNVYTNFVRANSRRYGKIPAIIGTSYGDVYAIIQKLMTIGIAPTHDDGWFGYDKGVLNGNADELTAVLEGKVKKIKDRFGRMDLPPEVVELSGTMVKEAVNEERDGLLFFIHGVYYEFIRRSISDSRLTYGLSALFAFIILHENKHVRKLMSYRYVMIDEFQDTNALQFMISLLILKEPNLCVVGDWKQGIYGFRYASVENITEFEERMEKMRDFLNKGEKRTIPGIRKPITLPLTENYRSTQLIIDTSFKALRCRAVKEEVIDTQRLNAKITKLSATRDHEYTEVKGLHTEDHDGEILAILQSIRDYVTDPRYKVVEHDRDGNITKKRQPEYGDIAVLCRSNAMCIRIKEEAQRYGIPAHLQGDLGIMATREGKLALAWLRYINNRDDVRGPVAILTDAGYNLAELREMFPDKHMTDKVPEGLKEQRDALLAKRRRINHLLTSIFEYHTGLNNDVTNAIISTISSIHKGSMLTISGIIKLMETDIERSERYDIDALLDGRSVTIQTMHKSKGLEYPIVIAGGLTSGKFPSGKGDKGVIRFKPLFGIRMTKEYSVAAGHHKIYDNRNWAIAGSASEPDRDEERRLFFVALSRAKQYITMTCSRNPSFFMTDMFDAVEHVSPSLQTLSSSKTVSSAERPAVPPYAKRKKRISLHEIMGKYEESGGGKGAEHGTRVHKDAQRMVYGLRPSKEDDETAYIRTVLERMKGAEIMTEVDCSLPVGDAVIAGRIDIIGIFDDRAEIHDIKTDMNRKNEDRYITQLSVYAYAAGYPEKNVSCVIDYVSQGISVIVQPISKEEIRSKAASFSTFD